MANTAKKADKNNGNSSKMFKTKRVLSESWAELSPAKSTKRTMTTKTKKTEGEGGKGWVFKLEKAKIRAKGKVQTKTKNKTDSTTTNKQDPQDTPAGRWITTYYQATKGARFSLFWGMTMAPTMATPESVHTHTHTLSKVNVARAG